MFTFEWSKLQNNTHSTLIPAFQIIISFLGQSFLKSPPNLLELKVSERDGNVEQASSDITPLETRKTVIAELSKTKVSCWVQGNGRACAAGRQFQPF